MSNNDEREGTDILIELRFEVKAIDLETHDFQDEQVGLNIYVATWAEVDKIHKKINKFIKQFYNDEKKKRG